MFEYQFSWQAQCASRTKFKDFTSNGFKILIGTPIINDNEFTGEYSTQEFFVNYQNVTKDLKNKNLMIKIETNCIFVPLNNEEQIIKFLYGLENDHLSSQSLKLVKRILTTEEYENLQSELRNKSSIKIELQKVYLKKRNELLKLNIHSLTPEQKFLVENKTLVIEKINSGQIII